MPALVLTGETISVRLESKHVEVIRWLEKGRRQDERIRVPLVDVDRVVLVGRPNVSIPVLQRLLLDGIPAYFVSARGRWIGTLTPDNNGNALRRIRQYQLAGDSAVALKIARQIVFAKIRNSRRVLQPPGRVQALSAASRTSSRPPSPTTAPRTSTLGVTYPG